MPQIMEIALFTRNVKELTDFYRRLLGTSPDVEVDEMSEFNLGAVTLRVHISDEPNAPGKTGISSSSFPPDEDHFAVGVEDLNGAVRSAIERGIAFEIEPTDFDWGRSAYLRDPDGRLIELSQLPK